MFVRIRRKGAVGIVAMVALVLCGCSSAVPHNDLVISVGESAAYNSTGTIVPKYDVDLYVSSKIYQELTGVKTGCFGPPCKPIEGVPSSLSAVGKYVSSEQRASLACLAYQKPQPVIRYLLFSAVGATGKQDPQDKVWYPVQIPMADGSAAYVLTPQCSAKLVKNPSATEIMIAKG